MEIWEVVGVDTNAAVKFNDGRTVQGIRWHLVGDAPSEGAHGRYIGKVVKDQFVSNERMQMLKVVPQPGQIITMFFNRYGDICKVEITG